MKLKDPESYTNLAIYAFLLFLPWQLRHTFFTLSKLNGQFNEYWSISIYLSEVAGFGLVCLYAYKFHLKEQRMPELFKFLASIAILCISLILLVKKQDFPRETLIHAVYWIYNYAKLGLIALIFTDFARTRWGIIAESLVASALFQAAIGIVQFFKQSSIGLHSIGEQIISPSIAGVAKVDFGSIKLIRAYGLFAHPNQLAAFLLVACATTLYLLAREQNSNTRAAYIIMLWVLLAGEALTFSRAGIAATALALCITLFLYWRRQINAQTKRLGIIVFACFASVIILFQPYLVTRAKILDQSNIERAAYDKIGIEIIKKYPLGVGPGGMITAIFKSMNNAQDWQLQPPHNYFLDVACETGILGAAAIIVFFAWLLLKLWRKIFSTKEAEFASHNILLLSIFLSFIILMQFDHYFYTLQQTELLLWVLIGMIVGAVKTEVRIKD